MLGSTQDVPEGHKGVAHEADGRRLMADGCSPADVLDMGYVAQTLHAEGKHQAAVHGDGEEEGQVEAVVALQAHQACSQAMHQPEVEEMVFGRSSAIPGTGLGQSEEAANQACQVA